MHTALAVTLAAHLVSAGCHAAAPLFRDVAVVKPYQQSAQASYQMVPAAPAPAAESEHSTSYRLPVHQAAGPSARYRGTAPLPGIQGTRAPGVFGQQQSALEGFTAQRLRDARNTNLGRAYTFRHY